MAPFGYFFTSIAYDVNLRFSFLRRKYAPFSHVDFMHLNVDKYTGWPKK